jgi:uncharacterized protein (DUF952 family)
VLYHVIEPDRWASAQAEGHSTASTRGIDLAEEGFIHLSRADQVAGVLGRFYADVTELLVLHVDESRLDDPVVDEEVGTAPDGTSVVFPHLFGPLPVSAVVAVDDAARWR